MGVGIWWCLIIGCGGNVFGVYVGSIIVYVMLCCLCICVGVYVCVYVCVCVWSMHIFMYVCAFGMLYVVHVCVCLCMWHYVCDLYVCGYACCEVRICVT